MFIFFQPNPLEKQELDKGKRADCAIRCLCAALDISWEEAYDVLCKYAKEVYEVPNFQDKKFDGMNYRQLTEYVVSHYSPYVFDDKIVEGIRKNDPKYDMWNILKEVA